MSRSHARLGPAPAQHALLIAFARVWLPCLLILFGSSRDANGGQDQLLTQLQFDIVGIRLVIDPTTLTVPKGIATFVNTSLQVADGATTDSAVAIAALSSGALVEAELRGPSIAPTRILARPGQPLVLPAFALPGDYFLDQIRLV